MQEHTRLALSEGIDIPDEPWGDLEIAADLIARRATYGHARTEAAKHALRLFGEALQVAKEGIPQHVQEFIDGYDIDPNQEVA